MVLSLFFYRLIKTNIGKAIINYSTNLLNQLKHTVIFVMLAYDLMGGGRVPKIIIKGMKYDDYIESLYQNNDLISELKNSIECKSV